ncbi:MAG: sodium:alanine symporter family protein [Magnetococcales bacterium]|nr:sodium:alanine symporter family protein [Magnetococcales bacterium]
MDTLAAWIWNPLLSLLYLEVGILFLILTGAVAWRKSFGVFLDIYRNPKNSSSDHVREISHSKAFFSAIAASVGVGNLAGVGTAIHLGGPGALFWMWASAIVGLSFRMCSTYLAIKYGPKNHASPSFASPMSYLERFLPKKWQFIAKMLAILLLIKGMVAANLIQVNSVSHAMTSNFSFSPWVVAVLMAGAVGWVVIGGIKRVVEICNTLAPWMILGYIILGLLILLADPMRTLDALLMVFQYAFTPYSIGGGVVGYAVLTAVQFGVSRGVFSHNSGMGVAPFLQASNSDHPSRGAFMAALIPMVDTLLVCTITGLVVISVGKWLDLTGASLTVTAFQDTLGTFGKVGVSLALFIFAYSTIISWSYYTERCFEYLGGQNLFAFRCGFTAISFIGPFFPVALVWSFADIVISLIIIVHVGSLTYIVIKKLPTIMADLNGLKGDGD